MWNRLAVMFAVAFASVMLAPTVGCAQGGAQDSQDSQASQAGEAQGQFRTFFVTRSIEHERFMEYIETARPEIVQVGNYGAKFHSEARFERAQGSPMMLPVVGERENLEFQRKINEQIHGQGLKVVAIFRLIKVRGDWEEKTGFVEYYNNLWPEDLLGEKPDEDLKNMLQRSADGEVYQLGNELALCLNNPNTRQMLKQMLKLAIDDGVDGLVTTYNYHFRCAGPYCQASFKDWLRENLTDAQIEEKLGVTDLEAHTFEQIPAKIQGYPDTETATDLHYLAMRWAAETFKENYDKIFIDYGRSVKEDLILAQWNHGSHVSPKEERTFLPIEMWGRGEDYFWYSGGAAFVNGNLNLSEGKAGDAWLTCLYVRALGQGKPFAIGKYDRARMAASMAEGYATGGLGMGRYMKFENEVGFDVLVRYTNFMHEHRALYDGAAPFSDAALVLPRKSVQHRHPQSQRAFGDVGQGLVENQTLIDVMVDQRITPERLAQYPAVILVAARALSDDQIAALRGYAESGGTVFVHGPLGTMDAQGQPRAGDVSIPGAIHIESEDADAAADAISQHLEENGTSIIDTKWTVRAAAYRQPNRVLLHLVNYDRQDDAPETNRTGPETELPAAVEDIEVELRLPEGERAASVTMHAPDRDEQIELEFDSEAGRVSFIVPRVLVYGVLEIETQ